MFSFNIQQTFYCYRLHHVGPTRWEVLDYPRETIHRHALEYLKPSPSDQILGLFPTETLDWCRRLEGTGLVGTQFGRQAPALGS